MRNGAYYNLSKRNHQEKRLNVILFIVVLMGILTGVILDSLSATLEFQRKKSFGSWHAALYSADDEITKQLSQNAMVEKSGIMYICGEIVDFNGIDYGTFGYADSELIEIGNIELLDGRMPENENEIAVEALTLSKLGYSYELGQVVILPEMNEEGVTYKNESYTLCGVVKNYSGNWKCETNNIIVAFVSSERVAKYHHVFLRLKKNYAKFAEDLNKICKHQLILNDYTYAIYSANDSESIDIYLLQIVILFAGFMIFLLLINNQIERKQQDYVILRLLGATRGSIVRIFIREKVANYLMMVIFGTVSGILVAFFAFSIVSFYGDGVFAIKASHIFVTMVMNLVGILIALIFAFVRIFQIPLRGKVEQQRKRTQKNPRKIINKKNIFERFRWFDKRSDVLSLVLSIIAISFILISFYQTWNSFSDYRYYANEYPVDYSFGLLASYLRSENQETEDFIKRIENAYGVSEVMAYSVSTYQPISFVNGYDAEYAFRIRNELSSYFNLIGKDEYPSNQEICGSLVGIPNVLSSFYFSLAEIKDASNRLSDNEVIIYLPDYSINGKTISEAEIEEGDELYFSYNGNEYNLKIVGIIRQKEYSPFCYYLPRPYSLICNQNTYDRICGSEDYVYVLANREEKSIAYQTDAELSKIKTNLIFLNNRVEKDNYKNNAYMQLIISLIICASGLFMIVLARYAIQTITNKCGLLRYKTLYQLGMEVESIKIYLYKVACQESILGAFIALLFTFIWIIIRAYASLQNSINYSLSQRELYFFAIKQSIEYTNWTVLMGIAILSFFINYLLLLTKNRMMINELNAYIK